MLLFPFLWASVLGTKHGCVAQVVIYTNLTEEQRWLYKQITENTHAQTIREMDRLGGTVLLTPLSVPPPG